MGGIFLRCYPETIAALVGVPAPHHEAGSADSKHTTTPCGPRAHVVCARWIVCFHPGSWRLESSAQLLGSGLVRVAFCICAELRLLEWLPQPGRIRILRRLWSCACPAELIPMPPFAALNPNMFGALTGGTTTRAVHAVVAGSIDGTTLSASVWAPPLAQGLQAMRRSAPCPTIVVGAPSVRRRGGKS